MYDVPEVLELELGLWQWVLGRVNRSDMDNLLDTELDILLRPLGRDLQHAVQRHASARRDELPEIRHAAVHNDLE
ncbi:hypothetical protein CRG98_049441, partial [Punica granatum]